MEDEGVEGEEPESEEPAEEIRPGRFLPLPKCSGTYHSTDMSYIVTFTRERKY